MNGLMMNFQLTLPAILRRADQLFGHKEIVTRLPDKSFHRYTYADFVSRAKKLSLALQKIGLQSGDRVGTFCWNHYQHLECYFGIPAAGGVLHTLNLRLSPEDLTFIANDAADKIVIVDKVLLPLFDKFKNNIQARQVIVVTNGPDEEIPEGTLNYEKLLAEVNDQDFVYPDFDEDQAAAMCYTSGTTGRPKGVLYSHRAITLHSLAAALYDVLALHESDIVLPVVPMFHANAWGLPFTATMVGAKQVFPGPHLDPESLLDDFEKEKVTMTGGVPTIWMGIMQMLEKNPDRWKLTPGMRMAVGGSAVPEAMLRAYDKFNLRIVQAWGMTEMTPLGTVANVTSQIAELSEDEQYTYRAKQGVPAPFVEIRARGADGFVPWDGQTMGELEVRGPWIASAYYNRPEAVEQFTEDGWFRTGDVVTIEPSGYVKIQDRSKDLIKSGGEWISSVDLENAIMGHPAVAEAAVIAIFDPKWQERPLAVVVVKQGQSVTAEELNEFLAPKVAKWWLPDSYEFIDAIPRTATGKFLKTALRDRFKDYTPATKKEATTA
jgi:fatty-acyl-CoA synthase